MGSFPGALWGVHGMSVDQEGNLYVAEVDNGRVQKFRPRAGANPDYLMAKPVKAGLAVAHVAGRSRTLRIARRAYGPWS